MGHPHHHEPIPPKPARFRDDPWAWYLATFSAPVGFILPLALMLVPAAVISALYPDAAAKMVAFSVTLPFALDVGMIVGLQAGFKPWIVLVTTYWVEFLLLVWLMRNLNLLRRWPRFDGVLKRQEKKAVRLYEVHRWVRRFHVLGVATFVFLPFSTGVFVGILLGKLTGMPDRRALLAVYLGTIVWSAIFVWAGGHALEWINAWAKDTF